MAKIVKCKTCGTDIAKSASKCPNCGAKQHQVVYTICSLLVVFMFVAIGAILVNSYGREAPVPDSNDEIINVSATDLWSAYSENKVNADNLYKGKWLAVTGTISDTTQDVISNDPCVTLTSGQALDLYPIQCFFSDDREGNTDIAALKDGQTIIIVGKCTGVPVTHVQLTNCTLSE